MTDKSRALLEITGIDRKKFLQGLITNDITRAGEKNLIYSAMLNSSGRFLYDFFIFEIGEKLVLDCSATRRDEILQKLNFYKLRSQVAIAKNDELLVAQNFSAIGFPDPRSSNLGHRHYLKKSEEKNFPFLEESLYHFTRISNKIPESEHDLTYEKSLILEFGFDNLNAIDYQKGCYIGQELTARTHYLGKIRKKLFHAKLPSEKVVEKNLELTCEGEPIGIVLSSVFHEAELHALALIRLSDQQNFTDLASKLELSSQKILLIS
jgi:folate-binding protein YgfZ